MVEAVKGYQELILFYRILIPAVLWCFTLLPITVWAWSIAADTLKLPLYFTAAMLLGLTNILFYFSAIEIGGGNLGLFK